MYTQNGRSRRAKAVKFFYDNAGFGYDPKKETKEQGRKRCAKQLAKAEEFAFNNELVYEWEPATCIGGDCGETETCEHPCCQGTDHEVLACILYSADHKLLASLGSICEPSDDYKRVVKAELALEAMDGE